MNKEAKMVLLLTSILVMLGIVMIYSSSAVYAYEKFNDSMYFVKKHLMYLALGLVAAILCMSVPKRAIAKHARLVMMISLASLVLVLVPHVGSQFGGARRWIRFFGFGIQPSEIAKLGFIIYLADFVSRKRLVMQDLRSGFLPPLVVIVLTFGLILLEPDMGTSVAVLFIGFTMLFLAGVHLKHLATIVSSVIPVLFLAVLAKPYRVKRILTFCDPFRDAKGAGFQLCQSFIALGSGGFFGLGLGNSKQKLFYLPESHTDFIFSIIGEELGFLGAASVVLIFTGLVWFALRLAFRLKDRFSSNLVLGITIMIAFEVIVNIGVSTGVFPTKGLPLPFLSYGGSSLVCHLAAVGLILNVSREGS